MLAFLIGFVLGTFVQWVIDNCEKQPKKHVEDTLTDEQLDKLLQILKED